MDTEAFTGLLREARKQVDPETVGLQRTTGRGRRAEGKGLSQAQVGQLIGSTGHTYGLLERGEIPTPTFDLLHRVARALLMREEEYVALCRYARGEDPPSDLYERSGLTVPGHWQTAVDGISHVAYVTDRAYNVLCYNQAYLEIHPDGGPANMMEWMLLADRAREILMDWETVWAPYVLPQLRASRSRYKKDATLRRIEKAARNDPFLASLYESGTRVQVHPDGSERPLWHPVHGPGWASICAASIGDTPGPRLMIIQFEAGERSHRRLPHLRAAGTSES
ncbi:helix-turn-helix domain-containing protein [Streptomyces olivaceiscleroticus]|uniref:HTH cro/C1-type domain-containing protein n=1 Tax=Streptomyces olivaceiscleroticus TaxID=68245 RepID=A0ABN1BMA8_9ACTN